MCVPGGLQSYILVPEMLEQLEFSVGSLGENGSAEGLHDLLDCHGLASELVLGRAGRALSLCGTQRLDDDSPDETKRAWVERAVRDMAGRHRLRAEHTHSNGLEIDISRCDLFRSLNE